MLPTGAGTSAIYQLTALIIPGPTVRNLDTTWGWLETLWLDRVDDDAWFELCRRYRERKTSFDERFGDVWNTR